MASAFPRVLLAYDDSAGSQIALAYACALAHEGARLTVAHAVDEIRSVAAAMNVDGAPVADPRTLIAALDERGSAVLQAAVDRCAALGVLAEQVFIHDAVRPGIIDLEHNAAYDLVVVGTHGRHGVWSVVLGSVAEQLVHAGRIPTLVVTAHAKTPRPENAFARALVAVDESAASQPALAVAARLATAEQTELVLCNVVDSRDLRAKAASYGYDPRPFEADLRAHSLKVLDDAKAASGVPSAVDDLVTVEGEPAERIEHTALQRNCDLVVVGTRLRSGAQRLLFGSVADAVIRSSAVPVLVVPAVRTPQPLRDLSSQMHE